MKPYHWESHHGNFGDDLNLWLWDHLLPGFRDVHEDTMLVGVGTVLNPVLLPAGQRKLVIGSGYGYGTPPDIGNTREWDVRCVRGPKTAARLGLAQDRGIVDPAVMVTEMEEFKNLPKLHEKTFIPHWESAEHGIWQSVCEPAGLYYLDPRGEAKSVIAHIAQSKLIVAESMHGAILADAFRVPWIAVSTSRSINDFKWSDWAESVEVKYRPHRIPVSTRAEASAKGSRFWGVNFNRRRSNHDVPDQGNADTVMTRPSGSRAKAKDFAKQILATPSVLALWQASRNEPQLSPDGILDGLKSRFADVLEGVRKDYHF